MRKRGRSREQVCKNDEELMDRVNVVGRFIPIQAHFEVVASLDAVAPWKLRLRPAPDPPADLDPELKQHWPKPEEWAKGPTKEQMLLLAHIANKALARGVEIGAGAMGTHLMTCMGFNAEISWGPEMEQAMQAPATGTKGGLVVP